MLANGRMAYSSDRGGESWPGLRLDSAHQKARWSVWRRNCGRSLRKCDKRNQQLCRPPTGEVKTYEELLVQADPTIGKSITPERFQAQWEACQRGIAALSQALEKARPDVAVIVTDDGGEHFFDDNYPTFNIHYGDTVRWLPRRLPEGSPPTATTSAWGHGDVEMDVPVASDLALHCIESLRDQDFDVTRSLAT